MVLPLVCGSLTMLSTWPTTIGPWRAVRGTVDRFFFKADLDELGHDVFGRCSGRYLREFTQPGKWDTHC